MDLSNLTVEQLQAMKAQKMQETQQQAGVKTAISQLSTEQLENLKKKFEGIKHMSKLPDAVLILDVKKDIACAREAKRKGITIIGITDTNIDPTIANYPIPANDDAMSSIKYILEKVKEAILNSK